MRDREEEGSPAAGPRETFLVIADISGYTRFMTRPKVSLAHAQAIITELLEAVIDQIEIPLRVAEIEGDGVFFFGTDEPGEYTWERVSASISEKMLIFFDHFNGRLHDLSQSNLCRCEACDGIGRLKLKMVVHIGEVLFHRIANRPQLSGPDVILIHKLLKNSVRSSEYLLMTDRAYQEVRKFRPLSVEKGAERYPDLGEVPYYVHYPSSPPLSRASTEGRASIFGRPGKLSQTMKISLAGLLIMLGLKRLPRFRNLNRQDDLS